MRYRLGLDFGTASMGWAVLELNEQNDPVRLVDIGVRIYSDGRDSKTKKSLAEQRRIPRGMRRRRDRYIRRRDRLMEDLIRTGLMPQDDSARKALESLDPYKLRSDAAKSAMPASHLGRALFHLNQRRGFKSNRKTDGGADEDAGIIRERIAELDRRLAESSAPTLGAYLYNRLKKKKSVRARAKLGLYPERRHYLAEFRHIRKIQAQHQALSEADWDALEDTIFYQRELVPVKPGRCLFEPEEYRAPLALPSTQRFRMLQEVHNLRIVPTVDIERRIPPEAAAKILEKLAVQKTLSLGQIAKLAKMTGDERLNLDDGKRTALNGDETAYSLLKAGWPKADWAALPMAERDAITVFLLETETEEAVVAEAMANWGLEADTARAVSRTKLQDGHGRISQKAISALLPLMEAGKSYSEAAKAIYGHHSFFQDGELLKALPYYGERLPHAVNGTTNPDGATDVARFGRFPNPTVHVGLNQLRRLVNDLIKEYGRPTQIVVELAREMKQTLEQKKDTQQQQAEGQARNEKYRDAVAKLGQVLTPSLMRRIRLWEEQGPPQARVCPYSGDSISFEMLVRGDDLDVDHILPYSRTLDDSMSNKVVCKRAANRQKGNRAPADAFTEAQAADIQARTAKWKANKNWRFRADAMERFENESAFLARQLNETRYLSRTAHEYLTAICPKNDIWVLPGKMTSLLRARWGLNSLLGDDNAKDRNDHRHHAIDAVVQALTDRALLQKIARAAARDDVDRVMDAVPQDPPTLPDIRDKLRDMLRTTVIYHKPEHWRPPTTGGKSSGSTTGALHNDTAYGLIGEPDAKGNQRVRSRKDLSGLKPEKLESLLADKALSAAIVADWKAASVNGMSWKDYTTALAKPDKSRTGSLPKSGVRRVRVLENLSGLARIQSKDGVTYKAYKTDGNAFMDIFALPNGKWRGETVTTFNANQRGFEPAWKTEFPEAKFVMRLHGDDLVAFGPRDDATIYRVAQMTGQKLVFVGHSEAGDLRNRHKDKDDSFRYFNKSAGAAKAAGLRRIKISGLGAIYDPGPPK